MGADAARCRQQGRIAIDERRVPLGVMEEPACFASIKRHIYFLGGDD
jgi:hypothetical protein